MASVTVRSEAMASETPSGGDDRLLFCPFCRECYEGIAQCPEHELDLVEFQDLPRQAHERQVRWDEPVMPWDIRFGRLEIALGVLAALVGFFALPLATGSSFDDQPTTWTGLDIASHRAPNLWTVPFAAALFVVFLYRRRTPLEMRGARLAGVLLALMPGASLAYSMANVYRGVERQHGAVAIEWEYGVWVIAAASVLLLAGSARFGWIPQPPSVPHGAEAEDEPARIATERNTEDVRARSASRRATTKRKRRRR